MENVEGWTSLLFPTMGKQGMEDANETQEEVRKSCKVKKLSNKKKNTGLAEISRYTWEKYIYCGITEGQFQ